MKIKVHICMEFFKVTDPPLWVGPPSMDGDNSFLGRPAQTQRVVSPPKQNLPPRLLTTQAPPTELDY